MLTRTHQDATTWSEAVYSDCERYRYRLVRVWDDALPRVTFVMLNPSKADEIRNDPTVERCQRRAEHLGFGAFQLTNIFAWRDTDPMAMRRAREPVGPCNDDILLTSARWADQVVAAWGVHGAHRARGDEVARLLTDAGHTLFHLGLSKAGHPRHPLYLPYARLPEHWAHTGGS
ncbi:DUF1643 domain-containing protein [Roseobacter sp. YSTF-M11]|uniref:DUF1643 domain-containing protein n=1 Tax=Roseobacter insulae TaxID=2859783 RepID=A0A9X1FSE0_9RHOB|nr:DUF1643 domain-containing protein [Roseobacter insulae]MBW4706519.1 DUF1643 domain-containing protein [Roseobacter insulae]